MARENYSFKKRQRELAQKKKREEKLQRKLEKKNPQVKADSMTDQEPGTIVQETGIVG